MQRSGSLPKRASGVVVPNAPRWYQRLGAWLIYAAVQAVTNTLRCRWDDQGGFLRLREPGPTLFCTWHNRLALSMKCYHDYAKHHFPSRGLAALVSASKDGAFLAAILECFKVQPVRGSSSRRGAQALLELTTWAERGYSLAITPDGPRGPKYRVQEGVISLAQLTGLPIVPVSCELSWRIRLRSWDNFLIPLPFSRCTITVGHPIHVPREADDAQREALRSELQSTMLKLTRE